MSEPWVSTYFTIKGMEDRTLETFHHQLEFIRGMGGTDMVLAEFGGAVNPLPVALFANRPIFDDQQWEALSAGLNRLGEIKARTLILWGTADEIAPPDSGEVYKGGITDSQRIYLYGAAHSLPG